MAVVLSELAKNADAAFRSLIVEEPEAHLHPQLQAVLLDYLTDIEVAAGEQPVQVFVTSHSSSFASIADLNSLICLVECDGEVEPFHPRNVSFSKGKREKLKRYLDVTRAEIFFARRIIFVEGAAELLIVSLLAHKLNYDLRRHGVSVISVEGLNFDSFMPLFGEKAIRIPVAVTTDSDPKLLLSDGKTYKDHYPDVGEAITPSANARLMKKLEDKYVRVFWGQRTFEYDLGLLSDANRAAMLAALKDIHPDIGADLEKDVNKAVGNQPKAEALFKGMFERSSNNVQKGKFAQALASQIEENDLKVVVPSYILEAIEHVCQL